MCEPKNTWELVGAIHPPSFIQEARINEEGDTINDFSNCGDDKSCYYNKIYIIPNIDLL